MTDDPNRLSTRDIANAAERERRAAENKPPENRAPQLSAPVPPATAVAEAEREAIFPQPEVEALRTRWEAIQTGFVDEPRTAVTEADSLVAQTVTRLAEVFSQERTNLEKQWDHGDNISTEDLRVALRRYRSFFDRLLSV